MGTLDWIVVGGYFFVMVGIGWWSRTRVKNVLDFFTAGGKMPWWLSGISHHMSGYSAVMFVAFASEAYRLGLTVYVWWALTIGVGIGIGAFLFSARWNRLRSKHGVASPLEYLANRYNVPTQQVMAWAGTLLKVVDIAAKWAAVAVLLRGFAGVPLTWGIVIVGTVTMVYSVMGGLWADALTDFGQFIIQSAAGIVMFAAVASHFGGIQFMWEIWGQLPAANSEPLRDPYTTTFFMALCHHQDAGVQRRDVEPGAALHGRAGRGGSQALRAALQRALAGLAADPVLPDVGGAADHPGPGAGRGRLHRARQDHVARRNDRPGARGFLLAHHGDGLLRCQRDLCGDHQGHAPAPVEGRAEH